jgi:hypothetical protein
MRAASLVVARGLTREPRSLPRVLPRVGRRAGARAADGFDRPGDRSDRPGVTDPELDYFVFLSL